MFCVFRPLFKTQLLNGSSRVLCCGYGVVNCDKFGRSGALPALSPGGLLAAQGPSVPNIECVGGLRGGKGRALPTTVHTLPAVCCISATKSHRHPSIQAI